MQTKETEMFACTHQILLKYILVHIYTMMVEIRLWWSAIVFAMCGEHCLVFNKLEIN